MVTTPPNKPTGDALPEPDLGAGESRNDLFLEIAPLFQRAHFPTGGDQNHPLTILGFPSVQFAQIPERDLRPLDGPAITTEDRRIRSIASNMEVFRIPDVPAIPGDTQAYARNVLRAADRIASAQPADLERVMREEFDKALTDFPGFRHSAFGRNLNHVWSLSRNPAYRLSIGPVAMLTARDGPGPMDGGRVLATAFEAESLKFFERDRQVFNSSDAAKTLLDDVRRGIHPQNMETFDAHYRNIGDTLNSYRLFEPFSIAEARTPPENALSLEQQARRLQGDPPDPKLSSAAAMEIARVANQIAFARPDQMQEFLTQAYDSIRAKHPEISNYSVTSLLVEAMNIATNSNDFSLRFESGEFHLNVIRDKRLKSETNLHGAFGAIMDTTSQEPGARLDPAFRAAFEFNMRLAKILREGAQALKPEQRDPNFYNSVISNLRWFR